MRASERHLQLTKLFLLILRPYFARFRHEGHPLLVGSEEADENGAVCFLAVTHLKNNVLHKHLGKNLKRKRRRNEVVSVSYFIFIDSQCNRATSRRPYIRMLHCMNVPMAAIRTKPFGCAHYRGLDHICSFEHEVTD